MAQQDHSSPAPAPTGPGVPFLQTEAKPPARDAHGFDLNDFDWVPVRRKARLDGWSPEKQRLFIATLADTGSVTKAARAVGMSTKSAYELRRQPDAAGFAQAWASAIRQGMNRLIDVCLERALEGTEQPIYDREGRVIGHRVKHHERMAMFLLRAHMPELFRDAHRADRSKGEALPPPPEPVADAMRRLDPVPPAAPHALMEPDDLEIALQSAEILDGKLPHWHRDRTIPEQPPERDDPARAAEPYVDVSPLGEQFERDLEAAKAGTWRPPTAPKGKRARRRQRV